MSQKNQGFTFSLQNTFLEKNRIKKLGQIDSCPFSQPLKNLFGFQINFMSERRNVPQPSHQCLVPFKYVRGVARPPASI